MVEVNEPLILGRQLLAISGAFGEKLPNLLSKPDSIQIRNQVLGQDMKSAVDLLSNGGHFLKEVEDVEGLEAVAAALRFKKYNPAIIIGADISKVNSKTANGFVNALHFSLVGPSRTGFSMKNLVNIVDRGGVGPSFCIIFNGASELDESEYRTLIKEMKPLSEVAGVFVIK